MNRDLPHTRNLRSHDRLETELDCKVNAPGDSAADATIVDLSAGGLRLACDKGAFEQLIPADQRIPGQVDGVHIEIRFALRSASNRNMSIKTALKVIHTLRLAEDSYEIGARFISLATTDRNRLDKYIEDRISLTDD